MSIQTNPDWSAWAREQLELDESSARDHPRQAYLRRVSDEDFLPPAHLPYALAVLEGKAKPPGANEEAVWAAVGDRQRQRVEEFARGFFQMPIDQRRELWMKLKADCASVPALVNRLDALAPGLALDPNGFAEAAPNVRELLGEASRIFVLRPFDAALARAAFFRRETVQSPDGMVSWETAARNLKASYPHYEILAPELIQQVLQWRARARKLSRRRALPPPRRPVSRVVQAESAPVARSANPDNANSKTPKWPIYVLIMVVGVVAKALVGSSSHTPAPTTYEPPEYQHINVDEFLRQQKNIKEDQELRDGDLRDAVRKSLERRGIKVGKEDLDPADDKKIAPKPSVVPPPDARPPVPPPDPANKQKPAVPSGKPSP